MSRPPPRIKGATGTSKARRPGRNAYKSSTAPIMGKQSRSPKNGGLRELNVTSNSQPSSASKKKKRKEEPIGIIVSPRSARNRGSGTAHQESYRNQGKPSPSLSLDLKSSGSNLSSSLGSNASRSPRTPLGSSGDKLSPVGRGKSPKQPSPRLESLTGKKPSEPSRPPPRDSSRLGNKSTAKHSPLNAKRPLGSLSQVAKSLDEDDDSENGSEDDSENDFEQEDSEEEVESVETKPKRAQPPARRNRFRKTEIDANQEKNDADAVASAREVKPPQGSRPTGGRNAVKRPSAPPPRGTKPALKKKPSLMDIANDLSEDESEEEATGPDKKKQEPPSKPSRPPPRKKPSLQDISKEIVDSSEDDLQKVPESDIPAERPSRPIGRGSSSQRSRPIVSPRSKRSTSMLVAISDEIDKEEAVERPSNRPRRGGRKHKVASKDPPRQRAAPKKKAVDLTASDDKETNALIRAAYRGKRKKVYDLIRDGVDPNGTDRHGWTALHWATSKGHSAVLEVLIDNDSDVNAADFINGWTPLHLSAINNQLGAAETLLDAGASCSIKDKYGDYPKDCVRRSKARKNLINLLSGEAKKTSGVGPEAASSSSSSGSDSEEYDNDDEFE